MAGESRKEVKICNKRGLHARAAAKFVTMAAQFSSDISVAKDELRVSGRSIMGLLLLAAAPGETIAISAVGADSEAAADALFALVEARFEEND